jgi:hypothetical protein
MAWTTPRTWVTGEVLTASIFNTHVRDQILDLDAREKTSFLFDDTQVDQTQTAAVPLLEPTPHEVLVAYTIPANTFENDGDTIHFVVSGTFAANANQKRINIRFGPASTPESNLNACAMSAESSTLTKWWLEMYMSSIGANQRTFGIRYAFDTTSPANSQSAWAAGNQAVDPADVTALSVTAVAVAASDITYERSFVRIMKV